MFRPTFLVLALFALPALAQEDSASDRREDTSRRERSSSDDRKENFGGAVAPAALPSGTSAAHAFVGAPGIGGGYRQGLGPIELEGRGTFNYLQLSLTAEVIAKYLVYREGDFALAPNIGFGLVYDSGSRYFDRANFQFFGLRPRIGAVSTLRVADTVQAIFEVEIPWAISVSGGQASHFSPLIGGGAEIYLGEDISGLVLAKIGVDAIKEPLGVTQVRVGYELRLGVGFRLF